MSVALPTLVFASPRKLPKPADCPGRVVVLDIAFAAVAMGRGFDKTTGAFIAKLGPRLARWVDHHDHPMHAEYRKDPRFVLATKAEHGACPEMITPSLVADTGPVDSIVCHFDLDGLYAAAKWIRGGTEPYAGADDDARAVDTRIGEPSPEATRIDHALRAHWTDETLKLRVVHYLVTGLTAGIDRDSITAAAADFSRMAQTAGSLADRFVVDGGIARLDVPAGAPPFDKTELLLLGQQRAVVSIVVEAGNATIAADFESGLDFVALLELGGGMPTRVNVPEKRVPDAMRRIRDALAKRG
ncbi:MAG: hypothetical protein IPH07_06675 [Deltaproteobacteria bacterium]|nr:hypothetical protein [Deltaproteobacteria bacterium]MBK8717963.1 hypothetical protein [Deltaproteobacteria bacterium]MBP7288359.1 hypothetical protein [Nannocystaceae bacterium]